MISMYEVMQYVGERKIGKLRLNYIEPNDEFVEIDLNK